MQNSDDPYERLAPFYDLALARFDADLDMYEAFARRAGAPVLELGAGTGRVALALARRGLATVGVDRSAAMLAIAARRAEDERISDVDLRLDDMRCLSVSGRFGLIICALDTFLHLTGTDEQLATLMAARERLAPDGLLLLDLPGPSGDWADWEPGARPLVLDWTRPLGDVLVSRLSSYRADLAEQTRHVTDIYEQLGPDGRVRRDTIQYPLRFVFPAEMPLLLSCAGLALHARYGDYDLSPFDATSERMIVLARVV